MYIRKTKKTGQLKRMKSGRVCKKVGCKQRLSVYNVEIYCNVHRREFLN